MARNPFTGFVLQIGGGHLSEKDQKELIEFILANLWKYPKAQLQVELFLQGTIDEPSEATIQTLQKLANEWLARR